MQGPSLPQTADRERRPSEAGVLDRRRRSYANGPSSSPEGWQHCGSRRGTQDSRIAARRPPFCRACGPCSAPRPRASRSGQRRALVGGQVGAHLRQGQRLRTWGGAGRSGPRVAVSRGGPQAQAASFLSSVVLWRRPAGTQGRTSDGSRGGAWGRWWTDTSLWEALAVSGTWPPGLGRAVWPRRRRQGPELRQGGGAWTRPPFPTGQPHPHRALSERDAGTSGTHPRARRRRAKAAPGAQPRCRPRHAGRQEPLPRPGRGARGLPLGTRGWPGRGGCRALPRSQEGRTLGCCGPTPAKPPRELPSGKHLKAQQSVS